MRAVMAVGFVVVSAQLAVAKSDEKPRAFGVDNPAAVDELARQIFAKADRNRNQFLSKSEFATARQMLAGEFEALGRQGLIGKLKPPNKNHDSGASPHTTAASDKLARSNRVSQAEFSVFAHEALVEADEAWRQIHAAEYEQRKAIERRKRSLGAQKRGYWYRF